MYPTYQPARTWEQNLEFEAPATKLPIVNDWPGPISFCGLSLASPLGVVAGPLLNSDWIRYYAQLGFDWLVYKTVRSTARICYPLPNLVPVECEPLTEPGRTVPRRDQMLDSWAVSFGMPSQAPDVWRQDAKVARDAIGSQQRLVVSVVGSTAGEDSDLQQLADDFARCARWAAASGADIVEANFSCPNVSTADGQLYQQPQAAALVADAIRASIGDVPLMLKIGYVDNEADCDRLVEAVGDAADALAMTNSISAYVADQRGGMLFDGQPRGICGAAIRSASCRQVARFRRAIDRAGASLEIAGVGGISSADHVRDYLNAGASVVGLATAVMTDPLVGVRIRSDWGSSS